MGGREIGVMPPHRRRIGYVAQVNDLFPHLSVEENISFGLKYQRMSKEERRARVERYISLMGLEGMAHRCVGGLSGGESKKVALARSLAVEPELLLLDEPLGMLDHNQRKELLGVLKTVHQQLKTTTIHITHDRREAWGIAQKCAVMSGGRILQVGTVAEVFRAPKSRFVAEFLGSGNLFRGVFREGEVQISGVVLSVRKVPSFREGWVVVRPEQISLVREGGSFRVSGVVKSLHDFGEYI
ncbi:MAG: ABC transporter ATP-binding protein, partial [Planctomycetota bacterium]|nr:ABC transporter ATP-binding protein [Planctomycetota bacterium]